MCSLLVPCAHTKSENVPPLPRPTPARRFDKHVPPVVFFLRCRLTAIAREKSTNQKIAGLLLLSTSCGEERLSWVDRRALGYIEYSNKARAVCVSRKMGS